MIELLTSSSSFEQELKINGNDITTNNIIFIPVFEDGNIRLKCQKCFFVSKNIVCLCSKELFESMKN
jgi:hypothetical protein